LKRPGLSSVVIIMLAIGIGGVTTIFTCTLHHSDEVSFDIETGSQHVTTSRFKTSVHLSAEPSRPGKTKQAATSRHAGEPDPGNPNH
jgi:hypothetical protein